VWLGKSCRSSSKHTREDTMGIFDDAKENAHNTGREKKVG
jgi:hypothetical protein